MKRRVLFLCTGNSCRSQMAEGFLRRMAGDSFEVLSAGTDPVDLDLRAVEAMSEVGIDISTHESKPVKPYLGERFHYVITVCDRARERCPIFPGTVKRLEWSFADPAIAVGSEAEQRQAFRLTRDGIAERVMEFLSSETVAQ